jgi:DNA-binding beta-propeller fold protein YncE
MLIRILATLLISAVLGFAADLASAPKLPRKLVPGWAKLPPGWNFGESTGVDVDPRDNSVWVANRGAHPVIHFDKHGRVLDAWKEVPIVASHGIRVDPEGNVWLVDVKGHTILKFTPQGRLLMVFGNPYKRPGDNDTQYAFNEPTGLTFRPNGDFYVSDGYLNSRIVQYNKDGEYIRHWGKRGKADGEFDIAHDVTLDKSGKVYVADRTNRRIQIFDGQGKFLGKWDQAGMPWGLFYAAKEDAIYMCDGGDNRVVKLGMDGQVLGTLGSFGKIEGKFDFAHNIAVDTEGSIYVVEIKNWRVQKFAK